MSRRIKNILPKLPFSGSLSLAQAPSSSPDFIIEHIPNNRLSAHPHTVPQFSRSASAGHPLSNSTNKLSTANSSLFRTAHVNIPTPQVVAHGQKRQIELYDSSHCLYALDYLNYLREQGDLCDATFRFDTNEVYAHRNILTGATPYFEGMFLGEFSEPDGREPIEIEDMQMDCFLLMLSFIYTGRVVITDGNVFELFRAAKLMSFPSLFETCNRFMFQILAPSNCIRIRRLAKEFDCKALVEIAEEFIRQNFEPTTKAKDFLSLSPSELLEIIQIERLPVPREEVMYEIVMQWMSEEPKKRLVHTSLLFPQLKFIKMHKEFLESILLDPRLGNYQGAMQIIETALKRKEKAAETEHVPPVPTKRGAKGTILYKERPQVYSTHTVEVYRGGGLLGIKLLGGVDRPTHVLRREDPPGIYITEIQPFGAAHRYPDIQAGDRILAINGISLEQAAHSDVIQLLSICPDPVRITFRHEPVLLGLRDITLSRLEHESFGLELASSGRAGHDLEIVVGSVSPDGAACRDGRVEEGLSVLHINSTNLSSGSVSARQGNSIVMCSGEQLHLLLADKRMEVEPDYLNFAPDLPTTSLPPPRPLPRVRMRANTTLSPAKHKEDSFLPPHLKPVPTVRTSFNVLPTAEDEQLTFDTGVDYEPLADVLNTTPDTSERDSLFTVIAEDDLNPYSKLAPKPDDPILSIPSSLLVANNTTEESNSITNPSLLSVQRENDPKATVSSWDDISDGEDTM